MEFYKYLLATLALGLTGCDSVGEYVATILPEKEGKLIPQNLLLVTTVHLLTLHKSEHNLTTPLTQDLPIGNNATELYQDPTQSPDYQEMIGALDDPSIDPGRGNGCLCRPGRV